MYYAKKSDWAAAEANKIRKQIDDIDRPYIPSSKWQAIRRREQVLSDLRKEQRRYEQIAERLRAGGK